MLEFAPSVLAAHPLYVARDVSKVIEAGASILHLDIMDGHFVPNISFGPAMVKALRVEYPNVLLDVHLMLSQPERYLDDFVAAGADQITIHSEIEGDVPGMLKAIRQAGKGAGISLKPATPAKKIAPYLDLLDLVLIMSVEPGFGGQILMPETLPKLKALRSLGFEGVLSVDGGVNLANSHQVKQAGATRLVMGTAAFTAEDPKAMFEALSAE